MSCSSTVSATNLPDADPTETSEWLDAFDDIVGRPRSRPGPATCSCASSSGPASSRSTFRPPCPPPTSTPSPPTRSRSSPATSTSSAGSAPTSAGTPPSWWSGPTSRSEAIGGHLSTYASSASLYEVGFNHFFRGKDGGRRATRSTSRATPRPASTPGRSSRAGCPRRTSTTSASRWATAGLSSYPHPRLMPDFWEYPTVSMGLGPLNAIAQAHVSRYLQARGMADTSAAGSGASSGTASSTSPRRSAASASPAASTSTT